MSAYQAAKQNFSLYRIEILWVFLFSVNSFLGSVLSIATQVDLDELSWYRIGLAVGSMFFNWTALMMVFVKQAGKNVAKGKTLFDDSDDNTKQYKKTDFPETTPATETKP